MSNFLLHASALLFVLAWGSGVRGDKMDVFRLPGNSKPTSYNLKIVPSMNGINSTFKGVVKIAFSTSETTEKITLNLKDLTVTNVTVVDVGGNFPRNVEVRDWIYDTKNEQFAFLLKQKIIANRKCEVTISYWGKIRDDLTGFYLSSYVESNETK